MIKKIQIELTVFALLFVSLFLTQKIDYYCFSFLDFGKSNNIKYEDVPILCDKFKIKKNLIKPLYLS